MNIMFEIKLFFLTAYERISKFGIILIEEYFVPELIFGITVLFLWFCPRNIFISVFNFRVDIKCYI